MHIRIESSFYGNELINLPDKILMEQCLLIGISISFTLPSISIIGLIFLLTHIAMKPQALRKIC